MSEATHFHIYGRKQYEEPLAFVTELIVTETVVDETLAAVGADGWVELVAIPASSLLTVTGESDDG